MTTEEYIEVFDAYRMYVFYFCKKLVNHQEDAEDITCNVFIALWNNREDVLLKSAKAYLIVTANHKCQDYFRTKKKYAERITVFSLTDLESVEIDYEVLNYLHKLIETLTEQQKKMILMKYKDGKEAKEIAKILNLKPQTVSNTLHSALSQLRWTIKNRGGNHG